MNNKHSKASREKFLSITKKDCKLKTYKGSGPGGQSRNKTDTCVTWTHPPSGATGSCCEHKSQWRNKQVAWRRMAESKEMQFWIKMQAGGAALIDSNVARAMQPQKLRVEGKDEEGRWSEEAME